MDYACKTGKTVAEHEQHLTVTITHTDIPVGGVECHALQKRPSRKAKEAGLELLQVLEQGGVKWEVVVFPIPVRLRHEADKVKV